MNKEIFLMIFGLALVTFIPRFLPFKLLENIKFSKRTSLVLKCIPFSAIGALILPDVVGAVSGNLFASLVGGVSAVVFSFFFKNYLYVVIGSIIMTYISIIIF
ncbi:MAG: AzlD domain-containing protein [Fusobacterium sp.]|uniref:AzlD domain-containing protein n=1 Tax=Fusobacterium sp. TaxID=68766 RepID=UPI002A7522CA|nr:AzlD domain-containing protein [Fusobacterium sp.]MDY2981670.1 AzlD domain-containing protein [Fusobacterium sp.]